MVIIGAAMNHWYHCDMNYRGIINMLMMWAALVRAAVAGHTMSAGKNCVRRRAGQPSHSALDWIRPPRQQNSTNFFYAHTDQWRYEKLGMEEVLSPLAEKSKFGGSMIDYNVRAERMGWLPSAPQLLTNPMQVVRDAAAASADPKVWATQALKETGSDELRIRMPQKLAAQHVCLAFPTCLGPAARGTNTSSSICSAPAMVSGQGPSRQAKPEEVTGMSRRPEGKLDLLVTLDFRMSDYLPVLGHRLRRRHRGNEKSDQHHRHAPVHVAHSSTAWIRWQSRSGWISTRASPRSSSEVCVGHLGVERSWCCTA